MIDQQLRVLRDRAESLRIDTECSLNRVSGSGEPEKFDFLRLALEHLRTADALLTCAAVATVK